MLASFIREATLVRNTRSSSEQVVLDHFLGVDRSSEAGDWFGYSVDYVRNVLPANLFERKRSEIGQLRADLAKEREDALREAEELQARIQGHTETLRKLESGFNFVGLSHAFQSLLAKKMGDARGARNLVVLLAVMLVALPMLLLWSGGILISKEWTPVEVSRLVAVLGMEIVVLYFFRVALRSYLLLRNQVTSLELRLALCQFIEGYIDFAGRAKASKSVDAVSGFEALIFSSLPVDDGSVPATLDGVEQIAKIIESLRKSN